MADVIKFPLKAIQPSGIGRDLTKEAFAELIDEVGANSS